MTDIPNPITCKSCARILATVSPGGLIDGPPAEGCSTCEQFTSLHDAMRAADEAYMPLMSKGDKHRGKQAALAEVARTRMIFHNYLMNVEAVELQAEGLQNGNEEEQQSGTEEKSKEGKQEQLMKDSFAENQLLERQTSQQLPHRLSGKRTHSISSVSEHKRIKFDDSVEFRDDYRSYLELNRSNKDYVPGRYAPPEEGYLDTSGSEISALKFTGMKRVKGGWVEVIPKEKKSKKGALRISSELQELGSSEDVVSQEEGDRTTQDETDRPRSGLPDPRAERLQRRTRRASSADTVQSGESLASTKRGATRKRTRASLNRTEDETSAPFGRTAAVTRQEEGSDDLHSHERTEDAGQPVADLHCGSKDHHAHEGTSNVQPTNSQPSDDSNKSLPSYQPSKDGEARLGSTDVNINAQENKPPTAIQMEFARLDSPVVASTQSSRHKNHDAHSHVQGIPLTVQDPEITESTEKNHVEPMRVDDQEGERTFEGAHEQLAKDIVQTGLNGGEEKSPTSETSARNMYMEEGESINTAAQ